jgi:hypothetical protein
MKLGFRTFSKVSVKGSPEIRYGIGAFATVTIAQHRPAQLWALS